MKIKTSVNKFSFLLLAFYIFVAPLINLVIIHPAHSIHEVRFAFPIIGSANFSNDYNAPRASGPHHAIDIFAKKRQKVIAAVSGTITYAPVPQPSWGYMVTIEDERGYRFSYIHLNNDTPGTDDGGGGPMHAYAPYVTPGNEVVRGQHIGYVGDSGNAEGTPPHLHFEVEKPDGETMNPYDWLVKARRFSEPNDPPAYPFEFLPYGAIKSGLNVAMGNTDIDIDSEVVTAPGKGGGPHVKIFEANGTQNKGFFAYDHSLRIGIDVAAGDIDGDLVDEIITGPGRGGGPHIRVFEPNGTQTEGFFAYGGGYRGGVHVAAGNVAGDNKAEIITSPMAGGSPLVRVFDANGSLISSFYAYDPAIRTGIDVAVGDVDGDGVDEIITAPGKGGGPHVRVFEGNGTRIRSFLAYNAAFRGGVRVSSGNVQLSSLAEEITVIPESTGGSQAKLFSGSGAFLEDDFALERWWRGYYDIAAGRDTVMFGTGINRRASVIEVLD